MKKKNIGSTLDSFLREEGLYEEVSAAAIKRVAARRAEGEPEWTQGHDGTPSANTP
jgi:hypothetical protein